MKSQYEIARDSDAPRSLLHALLEKRVLTFFSDPFGDGMYTQSMAENWHRYSAAPRICQGRETYYWALFDLPPHYFTRLPLSFAQFQQQLQQQPAAPHGVAA